MESMDDKGKQMILHEVQNLMYIRQISALQLKKYCRKGWTLYVMHVINSTKYKKLRNEDYMAQQEYRDVFPNKILKLPPKRDIDSSIKLLGVEPDYLPYSEVLFQLCMDPSP